jgi:hypothetical protein
MIEQQQQSALLVMVLEVGIETRRQFEHTLLEEE